MIARVWCGQATIANADAYVRHVTGTVFPRLGRIAGHEGAYLLRRVEAERVEFIALTLWDSMDAVRAFAGARPEQAVVEPEARAVLSSFDDLVAHFEVVHAKR
ncbi:MAG: antibiotic biosynthesis monooxygenase [Proteobacteria bacterium]|nr:antibiotic biosynthesis monooxygenase [Pseudomonadota bacterium]